MRLEWARDFIGHIKRFLFCFVHEMMEAPEHCREEVFLSFLQLSFHCVITEIVGSFPLHSNKVCKSALLYKWQRSRVDKVRLVDWWTSLQQQEESGRKEIGGSFSSRWYSLLSPKTRDLYMMITIWMCDDLNLFSSLLLGLRCSREYGMWWKKDGFFFVILFTALVPRTGVVLLRRRFSSIHTKEEKECCALSVSWESPSDFLNCLIQCDEISVCSLHPTALTHWAAQQHTWARLKNKEVISVISVKWTINEQVESTTHLKNVTVASFCSFIYRFLGLALGCKCKFTTIVLETVFCIFNVCFKVIQFISTLQVVCALCTHHRHRFHIFVRLLCPRFLSLKTALHMFHGRNSLHH